MAHSDILHDTDIEQAVGTEAEAVLEPPYRVFVHNDDVTNAISYYFFLHRHSS